jgi:hypothetical protein
LCYVYYFALRGNLPSRVRTDQLAEVEQVLLNLDDCTFEAAITKVVSVDDWSRSL